MMPHKAMSADRMARSDEYGTCLACGRRAICQWHVVVVADQRLGVLGDAGWCGCGYLVLSETTRLVLEELERLGRVGGRGPSSGALDG